MKFKPGELRAKAIADGWTVRGEHGWYEAHNPKSGRYIYRKGHESPRRFKTPRGAWSSIVGYYRSLHLQAQQNRYQPGKIPYLGD